ncbi:MAG: hypothetical protein ABJP48_02030 [Erythrobacter sp.]
MAGMMTWDMDATSRFEMGLEMLPLALLGSFAVGLPVALLTYFFAAKRLTSSPLTLLLIANLAGIVLILASFALADVFGAFFLGLPSWLAANVFGVIGWFWIVKPQKEAPNA